MRIVPFDPVLIRQQDSNVFVKGLSGDVSNLSLYGLFKTMGEIFSSRLAQDSDGKSRGYGFVQFTTAEAARRCVIEMNGKQHNDRQLIVEPYKARDKGQQAALFNNLYVKNLPPNVTTTAQLDELFANFGPRISVGLSQSELKGKVGYFGFVAFQNPADAARAAQEMNLKVIDGVQLCVVKALTKEQRAREKRKVQLDSREARRQVTLYVRSVTGDPLSEDFVRGQLQEFCRIKQIAIPRRSSATGPIGPTGPTGPTGPAGPAGAAGAAEAPVALPIGFVLLETPQDLHKVTPHSSPRRWRSTTAREGPWQSASSRTRRSDC
jgi:polyadenylate-binding protein